jgi:hypothetical protein
MSKEVGSTKANEITPPFAAPFTNTVGLAKRYRVSDRLIQYWVAKKILPVVKIGRCVRFNIPACDAALRKFERKAAG